MPQVPIWVCVLIAVLAAAACGAVAFFAGVNHRKREAEAAIGSAEDEAKRIISNAIKTAAAKKKEAVLEGKDEIHRLRNESEREMNDRRKEIQRQERRVSQKEESLDKKMENLESKENAVENKMRKAEERLKEAESVKKSQIDMLERISSFTVDQAKEYLLKLLEDDLVHEKAIKVMEYEQQTKEECDKLAREIISVAIQRCAADHVSEAAISVVPLPNDEMKGRIIGREGRNIRAIEQLTGVDLIIDDTPEAITLSSFEPVRREVARIALEKLISDGRIHPTRIEEQVCCMISAKRSTTRLKAPMWRSAWMLQESTRKAKPLSTQLPHTTATLKRKRSLPAWYRQPMPSRQHAPARAARTSKTISNVSKSSRPWLHRLTVWIAATPFRPAARSASW